ncbi:MAG: VOC family protein [Dysgonamonadaceae bacterium]|jgi:catechol 2,3-dioxygenase-like lactoylglutathione lyase family enzyme|nr:VOC family protein [Dysgonamonadaceae bacterium]
MKLHNCISVLFVKDAQKSKNFYAELGMTVIADFGGLNIVFKEGFAIWQISDGNIILNTLGRNNIENTESTSRFEICFETDNFDAAYKTVKGKNVKFLHEINTEVWGQRTIRFYDLDGHLIEVGEAMPVFLKRIFDEEGQNIEATSKRTFMPQETIKQILGV